MPLAKLFWFLAILTIVFVVLQVIGYSVIIVIACLLLIDLVIIEISRQMDRNKIINELKHELLIKIGNIERMCGNLINSLEMVPTIDHVYHIAEERILEHRSKFKGDFDKIAERATEIEIRLEQLRNTFAASIGSIDDRLRAVESK